VTLEAAKLAEVLKEAGHEVVWFAGELGERFRPGMTYPPAHFEHPVNRRLEASSFGPRPCQPDTLETLHELTDQLKPPLRQFLQDFAVDLVVAEKPCACRCSCHSAWRWARRCWRPACR
jgi:hypothetical protein